MSRDERAQIAAAHAMELARQLIARREALGLTQSKLAESMHHPKQVISLYETRGGGGQLQSFLDWADALGLKVVLVPKDVDE